MHNARKIWWIASWPKSGNTWVRMLVDAYVSGAEISFKTQLRRWAQGDLQHPAYQSVIPWPLTDVDQEVVIQAGPAALMNIIANGRGNDVCLKTHHCRTVEAGIPLIPPWMTKRAVYIVRDPRDAAISWAHHSGVTVDEGVEFVSRRVDLLRSPPGLFHVLRSWNEHARSWCVGNDEVTTTVVRYEDMLADPMGQAKRVLETLGLYVEGPEMAKAVGRASFKSLQRLEQEQGFKERKGESPFFRAGTAGQWREVLSPEQAQRVVDANGEMMSRLGYL